MINSRHIKNNLRLFMTLAVTLLVFACDSSNNRSGLIPPKNFGGQTTSPQVASAAPSRKLRPSVPQHIAARPAPTPTPTSVTPAAVTPPEGVRDDYTPVAKKNVSIARPVVPVHGTDNQADNDNNEDDTTSDEATTGTPAASSSNSAEESPAPAEAPQTLDEAIADTEPLHLRDNIYSLETLSAINSFSPPINADIIEVPVLSTSGEQLAVVEFSATKNPPNSSTAAALGNVEIASNATDFATAISLNIGRRDVVLDLTNEANAVLRELTRADLAE